MVIVVPAIPHAELPAAGVWWDVAPAEVSDSESVARLRAEYSHSGAVELIGATRTRAGLRVHAELDRGSYPLGVKVSDRELAAVPLRRHDWHGEWNYTVLPAAA